MSINVHEIFYFKKPTTITTYSDIPNGSPEISRLLNGQKPFPSADTAMQTMPKKIIVDLGMRYALKRSKQQAFDQRIQELQDEGLAIYFYHHNQLIDYDVAIIDNITVPRNIPNAEQLSQIMNIPVDELFILNRNVDYVISGFDAVSSYDLSEIVSLRRKEKICSVMIKDNKPLSDIDKLIGEFPTIKHLFLKTISYEELRHLKSYSNLSALETIDLDLSDSRVTSDELAEILAGLSIEVLRLTNCKNIQDTFPEGMNTSELKELDLSGSSITSMSLARIAKHLSNLKVLKLAYCGNINDPFPEELIFPELEELDVSGDYPYGCSMSGVSLASILVHTQKLKILNLEKYRNIRDVRLPHDVKFLDLEEINFRADLSSKPSVNMSVLVDFLSKSPNIKRLNLDMCDQIKGDLPDGLDFSHLEEINLKHSSLSMLSIYKILNQAKGLKKLDLEALRSHGEMSTLSLPMLQYLNVSICHISTVALTGLLSSATHLKYLDLHECNNIQESVSKDASFPALGEFDLSNSSITSEALYNILRTARQLKTLDLSSCKNIDDTLPHDLDLPELEELNLLNSAITNEALLQLVAKSSQLKKLNLYGCHNLDAAVIAGLQRPGLQIKLPDERHDDMHEKMRRWMRHGDNHDEEDEESSKVSPLSFLPETYNAGSENITIDADTRTTETTHKVERIFMGKPTSPDPRDLRYQTFDGFSLNEQGGMKGPFILHPMPHELSSSNYIPEENYRANHSLYDTYSKSTPGHYFCRTNLELSTNWQALPSAFADEELEQLYMKPSAAVELAKSPKTNLYYIRLKNKTSATQLVTVEMLLTRQNPAITSTHLPEELITAQTFLYPKNKFMISSVS